MKKLLSTTIILAMIATMMMAMCVSVSATDAVAKYSIFYKGDGKFYSDIACTQEITDLPAGLSADGNTITMENFHFATSSTVGLYIYLIDATIVVKGDNSISVAYTGEIGVKSAPGVIVSNMNSIIIKGDGSLKLTNTSDMTLPPPLSTQVYGSIFDSGASGRDIAIKVEGNPTLEFSSLGSFYRKQKEIKFDISSVTGMTAIASTDPAGSNPVAYNAADVETYKYFKLYKSETHGANTADSSNIALFIFMGMLSIAGAGLVLKKTQA